MVRIHRLAVLLFLLVSWAQGQETSRFRVWMGGQEVGGQELVASRTGQQARIDNREWIRVERLGTATEQKIHQTALRGADGAVEFTWSLQLSQERMEGRALWNPAEPLKLRVLFKDLPERSVALEAGILLWPGEVEARLKEAARTLQSVKIQGFKPALQQSTELELRVVGRDPLPGFPDAVRFQGRSREGAMVSETEMWISPTVGELKEVGSPGGLAMVAQRAELPVPNVAAGPDAFTRTLNPLPPHPFLPWLGQANLQWKGQGEQRLPEDEQQKRVGLNRLRLLRAALPNQIEAAQVPVRGRPSAEDAPWLAPSPLLQFEDPLFDGLIARLRPSAQATRWQLAQAVNRFVFDWVVEKDYTVGFASALEVVRHPRGDCTEHTVLAVALLRKLGVPARGVLGWIGTSEGMGLHVWVEVRLHTRWVPLDPTFDEAPASTLHVKVGTTDLADLGRLGQDTVATQVAGGGWVPEAPWTEVLRVELDTVLAPGREGLRLKGASWKLADGGLKLRWRGMHQVMAVPRPHPTALKVTQVFESAQSHRRGWWHAGQQCLWIKLDEGHWLRVSDLEQASALVLLDQLEWLPVWNAEGLR